MENRIKICDVWYVREDAIQDPLDHLEDEEIEMAYGSTYWIKGSISFFAKLFKPLLIWDWYDFGLALKVYKQNNIGNYHFAIDIQIGWLNLWVQCWQKH